MLSVENLSATKKKLIARELRKFLEPAGAKGKKTSLSEGDVKKKAEELGVCIKNVKELQDILSANFNQQTIQRLTRNIKKSVVWDCSICNLEPAKLEELFRSDAVENIITSLTMEEIVRLSNSLENSSKQNISNANFLKNAILEDVNSKYCKAVLLQKSDYVDNHLLNFCSDNGYGLYTFDYSMGLRAKIRGIDVTIFNKCVTKNIPKYTPVPDASPIILSSDLLKNMHLKQIIQQATELNGGKFLLTTDFVEELDVKKTLYSIRHFILFLLVDTNNSYTMYLNCNSSDSSIFEIAKKYNSITLRSVLLVKVWELIIITLMKQLIVQFHSQHHQKKIWH